MAPRSVNMHVAFSTCHPMRAAVATTAAAGPWTPDQILLALLNVVSAAAMSCSHMVCGIQASHMASAHVAIGSLCASYAGSALPFVDASAIMSARSRSCPQLPDGGADAFAAALLWA